MTTGKNKFRNYTKYFHINPEAYKWQIYCMDMGNADIPPGSDYPVLIDSHPKAYITPANGRVLNEFQIVYITRGSGHFKSSHADEEISEGTVLFLFPNEAHAYMPNKETGWHEFWIGFNGIYPNYLLKEKIIALKNPVLKIGMNDKIIHELMDLYSISEEEPPQFQFILGGAAIKIIGMILSINEQRTIRSEDEYTVQKARCFFEENIYCPIDLNTFVGKLGLKNTLFQKIFKKYTGFSPYQYFLHLKINKAQEILQNKGKSIKEISHMLSFDDQYYFSRIFKKKTGLSPVEWRKNLIGKDF